MSNTQKTKKAEIPPFLNEAVPVREPNPEMLIRGELWILGKGGEAVNANADAQEFDKIITQYAMFYDRQTWPLAQRAHAMSRLYGSLPMYYLPVADLTLVQSNPQQEDKEQEDNTQKE